VANVGFTLGAKRDGSTALPHVFIAGEITGPMSAGGCVEQGQETANAVIASLREGAP
jgi:heterodisulfide reductase subunit A-like polyferredoxin